MADQPHITTSADRIAEGAGNVIASRRFAGQGVPIIHGVNWLGLWTLYMKEVRRFYKVQTQTIWAPAITTLLFLVIFTLAMGRGNRMVLGVNPGHAVNPHQIAAQVEGSVAYGLSATFYGECTIDKGRVVESNFHDYPIMRLADMPPVETIVMPSNDFWGGVGEPTICVVGPAVLNAVFAATGKPVRSLPLRRHKLA